MAKQVQNTARRLFMAGSAGIALYAGLPFGAAAHLNSRNRTELAEDQLRFVSGRWEALPGVVGNPQGCVLGTIYPGQERAEYEYLPLEGVSQVVALVGPLSLVIGTGTRSLIYNAATRLTSAIEAPDGFVFTGAAARLPGGAVAVGLRHVSSAGEERGWIGLIDGTGVGNFSLHDLGGGRVVAMAWSSPAEQLLVMRRHSGKGGPIFSAEVSGVKLKPVAVVWNQSLEHELDQGRFAIAPHPHGGALVALSGSSPVPTAGNEAFAPDLDGPMDRAALMRGRVELPAQLIWVGPDHGAVGLEIPRTAPMRGLGTITSTRAANLIACTFWDSDLVILLRGGKFASHIFAHDLGLTRVAGAAILGDEETLAVCGLDRYTALVDLSTGKVKSRFRTENLQAYDLVLTVAGKGE